MRHQWCSSALSACASVLFLLVGAGAHEPDQAGPTTHKELTTVVSRIQSGLIFLQPAAGLQHRAISLQKAERMGLEDAQVGDKVTVTVDESNILLDIHKAGMTPAGHSLMTGNLSYADPFWGVIELSTREGTKSFAVDSLAGSKLSVLKEGKPVRVELDEDNMVIDIHPYH
jgi:hypothetical protein